MWNYFWIGSFLEVSIYVSKMLAKYEKQDKYCMRLICVNQFFPKTVYFYKLLLLRNIFVSAECSKNNYF